MNAFWKIVYVVLVAAVFAASVVYLRGDNPPSGNIRVTSRLDEYTRSNPTVPNTIPTFLMLAGSTGIVPADSSTSTGAEAPSIPVEMVKPVNDAELKKGFCTASTTVLIRQQYPGIYDDLSDAELLKSALRQHPEYKDRICILPVWISAAPHDIVKYDVMGSVTMGIPPRVLYLASGITVAFAIVLGVLISKLSS
jgi:hypothetical protein